MKPSGPIIHEEAVAVLGALAIAARPMAIRPRLDGFELSAFCIALNSFCSGSEIDFFAQRQWTGLKCRCPISDAAVVRVAPFTCLRENGDENSPGLFKFFFYFEGNNRTRPCEA